MTFGTCTDCKREIRIEAKGLCVRCYRKINERARRARLGEALRVRDRERSKSPKRQQWWHAYRQTEAFKEANRERMRQWRIAHPEEWLQIERASSARRTPDREKVREMSRAAYLRNPADALRRVHVRHARMRDLPATLTLAEWDSIKEFFDHCCAYCGDRTKLTQDHVIPVSKGGGYTADNILPACAPCNRQKHDRDLQEFLESLAS